jgi:hypothetical protein
MKTVLLLGLLAIPAWCGPPFQTDDPEPIGFRNYEFYSFATADGTPVEMDTQGPAVEFNWGALPNLHLHIIIPAAAIFPGGPGARAFGIGDIEMGIKYRFVEETKRRPMIGTFVMFELPTGSSSRGLGVGKTWYKLPLWVQKSFGPWTTYGGAGETVFKNVPGYRNYPFAGWLVQRDLGKKVTLGTEVFLPRTGGDRHCSDPARYAGRLRGLLQISRSRVPAAVLLRTHRGGAKGKLRVSRPVLDLGQEIRRSEQWHESIWISQWPGSSFRT